jgi:hypothetical protein
MLNVCCCEDDCTTLLNVWRACPVVGCKFYLGYCSAHGGDEKAVEIMQLHIRHAPSHEEK